jgi:hypothetical protein
MNSVQAGLLLASRQIWITTILPASLVRAAH